MNANETATFVQRIGNVISNILLGQTKEIIIRTDQRVKGIEVSINELKATIKELSNSNGVHETNIAVINTRLNQFGVSNSPMTPNDEGRDLLKKSGFLKQYPLMKDRIFAYLKANNARTLYDYEKYARSALESIQDDPIMDPVKNFVVYNPTDYSLELIFGIASWIIRDDYVHHIGEKVARDKIPV